MRIVSRTIAVTLAVLFALVAPSAAQAQNAIVTGKVTATGTAQPLANVNVYINTLNISVATDEQGTYTITIPSARCCGQLVNLRVRALGYRPESRPYRVVAGRTEIDFTLQQDVNRLDEIVVTGSLEGTERSKVAFSVGRLATEDLPVPGLDPLRSLEGKIPGVRKASW